MVESNPLLREVMVAFESPGKLSIMIEKGLFEVMRRDGMLVKSVADRDKNCGVFALRALRQRHYHEGISRRLFFYFLYQASIVLGAPWELLAFRHS